jgi:hypothetical protein
MVCWKIEATNSCYNLTNSECMDAVRRELLDQVSAVKLNELKTVDAMIVKLVKVPLR